MAAGLGKTWMVLSQKLKPDIVANSLNLLITWLSVSFRWHYWQHKAGATDVRTYCNVAIFVVSPKQKIKNNHYWQHRAGAPKH